MSTHGVKGKKRRPKPDNPAQSERFIAAAKALSADESGKAFKRAMNKIVPRKRR